jgi:hypothetical protein
MAEVLKYYILNWNTDKIVQINDDGITLSFAQESADYGNLSIAMCEHATDDDYFWVGVYSGYPGVRLIKRSDLTTVQVGGNDQNLATPLFGGSEFQHLEHIGNYVYGTNQNNNGRDQLGKMDINTGVWESVNLLLPVTSIIYPAKKSQDGTKLWLGYSLISNQNGPRVSLFDPDTISLVSGQTWGTGKWNEYPGKRAMDIMPDGSVAFAYSTGSVCYAENWDPVNKVVNYKTAAMAPNSAAFHHHVSGSIAHVGGSNGVCIEAYNYLTGVPTGDTYTVTGGSVIAGTRNRWGETLVVGSTGTDADADGSWNIRVLNSDFTTARKAEITGQLNDVLAYQEPEGFITTQPVDSYTVRQLVAFGTDSSGNGECWYESTAGTMAEITDSNNDIDTSLSLTAAEAYQKVFIANDSNLKVADFGNKKIVDANGITNLPAKGDIIAQGASRAVFDYADNANNAIYIKPYLGTFIATTQITNATQSSEEVMPSPDTVTNPPHWYTWGAETGKGGLPARATLVCNYRGRLVLAGNPRYPHQWYMSRQAHPWDWLYLVNDAQAPVSGSNADAGEIGDIITCLAPNKDDYMIMGCVNSIWVMRGDPAAGGSLDEISLSTGVFGPHSYCWDSMDNFYFWGSNGICKIGPGLQGVENLTITKLPNIISDLGVAPATHRIVMGYDREREGLVIAVVTLASGSHNAYFYDLRTSGFFPENYGLNPAPFSLFWYQADDEDYRKLLVGGADGYIRYFDDSSKNDDTGIGGDVAMSSYAVIGPMLIGEDADSNGRLKTLSFTTSTDTDGISYDIHVADSAEEVVDDAVAGATPLHTGTLSAGNRVQTTRPRARGAWMGVKLKNTTIDESWEFEKLVADVKPAGDIK